MASLEYIVIDFGVAWSKAFHLVEDKDGDTPVLTIKDQYMVPTSTPDLEISYKELLSYFQESKKVKVILTSSFCKKEAIESFSTNSFVESDAVYKTLSSFFGRSMYDVLFVDGGASNFLQNFEPTKVGSLTYTKITEIEIENYLGNKRRFLFTKPLEDNDSDIETSFLKNYLLTRGLATGDKNTLVIASGGVLSHTKNHKLALEIIADRLSLPFCQILLDTSGVLPCFGALLTVEESKKEILQVPSLISLAALINLGGPSSVVMDFGFEKEQKIHVGLDEVVILPAEKDKEVVIKSIGKQELKTNLTSGITGVLIDGRVKPFDLLAKSDLAKEKIKKWHETISTSGVI